MNWFSRLGEPLADDERAQVTAMLGALDLSTRAGVTGIASWIEAGAILRDEDRDNRAWDAEEGERERLWTFAAERMPEADLLEALNDGHERLRAAIHRAAATAVAHGGVADATMIAAAAGAAMLAAHQRQLAHLAGAAGGHYFEQKLRLFTAGRWPLGFSQGRFVVF